MKYIPESKITYSKGSEHQVHTSQLSAYQTALCRGPNNRKSQSRFSSQKRHVELDQEVKIIFKHSILRLIDMLKSYCKQSIYLDT